ncbi:MAG: PAS domain S-box protein [Bacteroidales bacterium]
MNIDIRTLILVLGLTNLLQVVVFIYQFKTNRSYEGVGWWLLWSAAVAAGFGFAFLREIPEVSNLAIVLQNMFIIIGAVFMYVGVLRFLGRKESLYILLLYIICFLSIIFFVYAKNSIVIRGYIINSALAFIFFITGWELYKNKESHFVSTANFIVIVFLLQGLFFVYRVVMILFGTSVDDYFIPTFFNSVTYINGIVISLIMAFGFIIMLNQRLNFDAHEAKAHFETIFNMSPDATLISRLDDGVILNINQGYTNLTGYTYEESVGNSSIDIPIWADPNDRQKIIAEIDKNGFCRNLEAPFIHKNGNQIIGLISASKIILQDKPLIISVTRDITHRRQAEEELLKLKDNLANEVEEKTKELKERVIELERYYNATISREMRVKELKDKVEELNKQIKRGD